MKTFQEYLGLTQLVFVVKDSYPNAGAMLLIEVQRSTDGTWSFYYEDEQLIREVSDVGASLGSILDHTDYLGEL